MVHIILEKIVVPASKFTVVVLGIESPEGRFVIAALPLSEHTVSKLRQRARKLSAISGLGIIDRTEAK